MQLRTVRAVTRSYVYLSGQIRPDVRSVGRAVALRLARSYLQLCAVVRADIPNVLPFGTVSRSYVQMGAHLLALTRSWARCYAQMARAVTR